MLYPSEVFNIYSPPATSRPEMPYLHELIHATNRLLLSLLFRSVDAWNALPAALRSLTPLPSFKHSLKQINRTKFLMGPLTGQVN
jgi:hypothetical protein